MFPRWLGLWRTHSASAAGAQGIRSLYRAAGISKDFLENPFYDKYKKKLERVQGYCDGGRNVSSPTEKTKAKSVSPEATPSSRHQPTVSPSALPKLNSIMKVELLQDKSSEEIEKIWVEYHKTKDCICAVMPSSNYLQLDAKLSHCPMFVYPLPRDDGYEMWFAQSSAGRYYFTSLINYQMFQQNAPISFTLTHYTEFLESKGIVLVHGQVDTKDLSLLEAQNLTNQMQLYYTSQRPELYSLVHQFNHDLEHFDYKLLIDQLNNISV